MDNRKRCNIVVSEQRLLVDQEKYIRKRNSGLHVDAVTA